MRARALEPAAELGPARAGHHEQRAPHAPRQRERDWAAHLLRQLEAALGRVLAFDVVATETLPSFARSTMDGR